MKLNEDATEEKSGKCPMSQINSISQTIVDNIRKRLNKKYTKNRPLRAVHAKSIGMVQAELIVEDLKSELSIGLFKKPRHYETWIRFTNGSSNISADKNNGTKGMAIKIKGSDKNKLSDSEPGVEYQDIILLTSRIFYPASHDLQLSGIKVATGNIIQKFANAIILIVISPFKAFRFFKSQLVTPNVLEETYYSCTPYKFGPNAIIKWAARPLKTITSIMPDQPGDNYLRKKLIVDLASNSKHEVEFELLVQFQESKKEEPVEDTTVIWKTPFQRVATIKIPKQALDTIERGELDEQTYFCPGNSLKDHEPVGAINLIRSRVYAKLGKERKDFGSTEDSTTTEE